MLSKLILKMECEIRNSRNQLRGLFPYQGFALKAKPFQKRHHQRDFAEEQPLLKVKLGIFDAKNRYFVLFLKCRKFVISLSNLVTHRFKRYGSLGDIPKQESFKGLLGMTKLWCQ